MLRPHGAACWFRASLRCWPLWCCCRSARGSSSAAPGSTGCSTPSTNGSPARPARLPVPDTWDRLDPAALEFQRIAFRAEFQHDQEALVFTGGSALRPDVTGHGYWVFTPARLPGGGTVVVNRGFVPEGARTRARARRGRFAGPVEIVGVLRPPEARGLFTPADNPEQEPVVRARPPCHGGGQDLGVGRAVLRRSGSCRCRRAGCRAPERSRPSCRTTTCSTRSHGTGWRLSSSRCSSRGCAVGAGSGSTRVPGEVRRAPQFPENREFNREFGKSGAPAVTGGATRRGDSRVGDPISLRTGTGNLRAPNREFLRGEQGMCRRGKPASETPRSNGANSSWVAFSPATRYPPRAKHFSVRASAKDRIVRYVSTRGEAPPLELH